MMNRTTRLSVVLLALLLLSIPLSAAVTVTSGSDSTATLNGAVRYRNFSGSGAGGAAEVYVGAPGFSGASTGDLTWSSSGNCVQIAYDGTTLTTKVAPAATPCVFTTAVTVSKSISLGTLNYLEIAVTKNTPTTSIALNNVTLGTDSLGSFAVTTGSGTTKWNAKGFSLTSFTVTGTVNVSGVSGGGDSNYIEVDFGSVPPSDNQGPITSGVGVTPSPVLLNGNGTVVANVDDSTTGGNTIASANYRIDTCADAPCQTITTTGTYSSMAAQDGTFDQVSEEVTATFTVTQVGPKQACVYGTDSLGNAGTAACQTFLVTYNFAGFLAPVDNSLLNAAKAGQAIPVKWQLTDANGIAISDPGSFDNLMSYPTNCSDLSSTPVAAVDEVAAGGSALQYLGDGNWQFNWKTPKNYAGTCRGMYVVFDSTATSPVVFFSFK